MANRVRTLLLTDDQRAVLLRQARAKGSPARAVERARIVLLAADGVPGVKIAERVGCSEPTVIRWRSRFAEQGLAGLVDEPRSGKPPTIPGAVRDQILSITLTEPPAELGITHWSSRLLAARLRRDGKPVSPATVARVWKSFGIQPHRSGTFKFSTDPELEAKVRDIVGLYLVRSGWIGTERTNAAASRPPATWSGTAAPMLFLSVGEDRVRALLDG